MISPNMRVLLVPSALVTPGSVVFEHGLNTPSHWSQLLALVSAVWPASPAQPR